MEITEQSEPYCRHTVKRAMSSQAMRKLGQKGLKQNLLSKGRNQDCYFKDGPCSNIGLWPGCALLLPLLKSAGSFEL